MNWEQIPHDEHVSLIAACIPGQKRDSRARLMLLSALWCALCIFRSISGRREAGTMA